jgi:hypothetical protein
MCAGRLWKKICAHSCASRGCGGGQEEAEELARQTVQLQRELTALEQQELALDESCRIVQHSLKVFAEARQSASLAYVTHADARNLTCFHDKTLLAFKAPSGTELTVPEPHMTDGATHFSLRLCSDGRGPIDALLLCDGAFDADALSAAPAAAAPATTAAPAAAAAGAAPDGPANPSSTPSLVDGQPAKRSRTDAGGPAVRLSPPPGAGDYIYQMHRNEGIADLFQLN